MSYQITGLGESFRTAWVFTRMRLDSNMDFEMGSEVKQKGKALPAYLTLVGLLFLVKS